MELENCPLCENARKDNEERQHNLEVCYNKGYVTPQNNANADE